MLEIKSLNNPYNSPLVPLIFAGYNELASQGMASGDPPTGTYCKAFYAEENDQVVGVLCWSEYDMRQEAWIEFGYVVPDRRGQGIYRKLLQALEDHAVKAGFRSIACGVNARNTKSKWAHERSGMSLEALTFRKKLPFKSEVVAQYLPEVVAQFRGKS